MDDDLRERDLNACAVEAELQLAVEQTRGLIDILLAHDGGDAQHHAAVGELLHAGVNGIVGKHLGILRADLRQQLGEHLFHALEVLIVGNGDVGLCPALRGGAVEDVAQVGVVDDLDVVACVADVGGADADLLDCAAEAADLDDVADVELILKDEEKTTIFDFFSRLGRHDSDNEIKLIDDFKIIISPLSATCQQEKNKYGKMSVKISFLLGLMVAILII